MGLTMTGNLDAMINTAVGRAIDASAEEGAERLRFGVSNASGPRTGVKYADLPVRSSVNIIGQELPASQSQDYENSMKHIPGGAKMQAKMGSFGDDQEKIDDLEFGNADNNFAARAPIQKISLDPDTHKAMNVAAVVK